MNYAHKRDDAITIKRRQSAVDCSSSNGKIILIERAIVLITTTGVLWGRRTTYLAVAGNYATRRESTTRLNVPTTDVTSSTTITTVVVYNCWIWVCTYEQTGTTYATYARTKAGHTIWHSWMDGFFSEMTHILTFVHESEKPTETRWLWNNHGSWSISVSRHPYHDQ